MVGERVINQLEETLTEVTRLKAEHEGKGREWAIVKTELEKFWHM